MQLLDYFLRKEKIPPLQLNVTQISQRRAPRFFHFLPTISEVLKEDRKADLCIRVTGSLAGLHRF